MFAEQVCSCYHLYNSCSVTAISSEYMQKIEKRSICVLHIVQVPLNKWHIKYNVLEESLSDQSEWSIRAALWYKQWQQELGLQCGTNKSVNSSLCVVSILNNPSRFAWALLGSNDLQHVHDPTNMRFVVKLWFVCFFLKKGKECKAISPCNIRPSLVSVSSRFCKAVCNHVTSATTSSVPLCHSRSHAHVCV